LLRDPEGINFVDPFGHVTSENAKVPALQAWVFVFHSTSESELSTLHEKQKAALSSGLLRFT
jgi:hypothetical protein